MTLRRTPLARNPRRIADWQRRSKPIPPVSPRRAEAIAAGEIKTAATRTTTGFSRSVKLAVRTRAGNGDPDLAMCEACGKWLGRRHGQVHHRVNRGAGGCADEVINGPANAALLCGTPLTGCHGEATALRLGGGFVIGHGTTPEYDPRYVTIALASPHRSGIWVYLAADGKGDDGTGYLTEPPQERAA